MKTIIVTLLMLSFSSNLYPQIEYKIISGKLGTSCNTINELASNGFEINSYYIKYTKNINYSSDRFLLSKKENSKKENKSYLQILAIPDGNIAQMYVFGNLPTYIQKEYKITDGKNLESIINELSEKGYQVEHFICDLDNLTIQSVILSTTNNGNTSIRSIKNTNDNDVIEKARYNLNGIPINENEKGIQIVVYSDYTTKIINVK